MNRKTKGIAKKKIEMYNETLYEVERVVSVKWIKNQQYCYIKWKGYDENYNTWEPKEHITFCYKESLQDDKDDDPEYLQNINIPSRSSHSYHTRAKKIPTEKVSNKISEQRQDHTQQYEIHSSQNQSQFPKIKRPPEPPNSQELQLKRKVDKEETTQTQLAQRDSLIHKILCFDSDDNSKKIAKVELQSGKIAHMDYSTIRKHFSDKLIDYYERCLENK